MPESAALTAGRAAAGGAYLEQEHQGIQTAPFIIWGQGGIAQEAGEAEDEAAWPGWRSRERPRLRQKR